MFLGTPWPVRGAATEYNDHSTNINACEVWDVECEVWGVRVRVQTFRRELHTYIHLECLFGGEIW